MAIDETQLDNMVSLIKAEYMQARQRFAPMRGPHEGWAVIWEELDEMWDEVKANDISKARGEALQVAAMALAFLMEVYDVTQQ